ncbi:hypothetical protein FOL47_002958 [Perkinsus chesapeaki]|uniref:Uncharacterized protein n=1 Tax=Perkinsus chesapeaki TaxID=330153 RepID=A0A7J6MAH8_PERCH|nr:hypothetical protein FOL47_002958 [Perkinsus chesapeaki]
MDTDKVTLSSEQPCLRDAEAVPSSLNQNTNDCPDNSADFNELVEEIDGLIRERQMKFLGDKAMNASGKNAGIDLNDLKFPDQVEVYLAPDVYNYFRIRIPTSATCSQFGYGLRLRVGIRCHAKDTRVWAYGSHISYKPSAKNNCCSIEDKELGVLTWVESNSNISEADEDETTFTVAVTLKRRESPNEKEFGNENRRKVVLITQADKIHLGLEWRSSRITHGTELVKDKEARWKRAAKKERQRKASRASGDKVKENAKRCSAQDPIARWMAQCERTIRREMR